MIYTIVKTFNIKTSNTDKKVNVLKQQVSV